MNASVHWFCVKFSLRPSKALCQRANWLGAYERSRDLDFLPMQFVVLDVLITSVLVVVVAWVALVLCIHCVVYRSR